jgi:cell wall-associated NlpC family hydrolase
MKKVLFLLFLFLSIKVNAQFYTSDSTLNNFVNKWLGKPYKFGGGNEKGIDCSNLVRICYKEVYNFTLHGATKYLMKQTIKVEKELVQIGDILFFRSKQSPSGYHCGIYIGDDRFFHAANRKDGVIISEFTDEKYQKEFLGAGRL